MSAWRIAAVATWTLLALQWASGYANGRGEAYPWWLLAGLLSLPLVLPALGFLLRKPRAPLWAGIAALFYFCLWIAEFRVAPSRWAAAGIALSVLVVFAAGWPGIAAKLAKRRTAPPTV